MLHYVAGLSEGFSTGAVKVEFSDSSVWKTDLSCRRFSQSKDPLTMEKQAKVVFGETERRLETRVKEHRDACQKGALEKSALAEHAWMNHHPIQWEEVSVIDRARTAKELLVKEAIHIRLNHPSLNRDGGLELPRCWMAALKNTGSVSNQKTCGANWQIQWQHLMGCKAI